MLRRALYAGFFGFLISIFLSVHCSAATKPNILLITLDSTRADRMGFLGAHDKLTPSLDALARQSIVFDRAYAQAPGTVVSHATILSGTYPQTHHASELGSPLAATLPLLPDLLHSQGYRTAAFVGSIQLDPREGLAPGFDRGFDAYDAGFRQSPANDSPQGAHASQNDKNATASKRSGDQVIARAIKWLAGSKQPFFLWVNLSDPQAPYATSYDHAIAAADAALGKLLTSLHTQKLFDDAIIVVAADHGESLGAHGEDTHGIFLYDETIHVPLLVKLAQNQMAGKRVVGRVRLLDVAPTVLEAAAVPVLSQMQGQSLLRVAKSNSDSDQPAYSRSDFPQQAFGWSALESWRVGKYLYIRAPKPELYDLSADPSATRNLAQTSKATLETIAAQLSSFDGHFGSGAGKSPDTGLTSSEMQKLASLGYVGLQKSSSAGNATVQGTDPKDTIATADRTLAAMLTLQEGKPDKAIPVFRQVLTAQPDTYLAQYGLGVALAHEQQYPEAIEHLHKAIELQPDSAWAHYEMGLSLLKTKDFKTAAVHLEIASSRLPESAAAHSALADAYDHLNRGEDANRERAKAAQPAAKP